MGDGTPVRGPLRAAIEYGPERLPGLQLCGEYAGVL